MVDGVKWFFSRKRRPHNYRYQVPWILFLLVLLLRDILINRGNGFMYNCAHCFIMEAGNSSCPAAALFNIIYVHLFLEHG